MALSKLKLNPDKTEFIIFGSKAQCQKLSSQFLVNILGSLLHPADIVKNLVCGSMLTFLSQNMFKKLVKPALSGCVTFIELLDGILLKKGLSLLHMPWLVVVWTIVTVFLEVCHVSVSTSWQSIQNTLAHIVTNHRKHAHITPILKPLYWLPVNYCCMFKTATLVYKVLHSGSPSYFGLSLSLSHLIINI